MCFPPDVEGVSERFVAGVMTVSKRKTQIFVNICELVNLLNKKWQVFERSLFIWCMSQDNDNFYTHSRYH